MDLSFAEEIESEGLAEEFRRRVVEALRGTEKRSKRVAEELDLRELAVAFPENVGSGCSYWIERSHDRLEVGRVLAGLGKKEDALHGYLCGGVVDGLTVEACVFRKNRRVAWLFVNGECVGQCIERTGEDVLERRPCGTVWEIREIEEAVYQSGTLSNDLIEKNIAEEGEFLRSRRMGRIRARLLVGIESLRIHRPGGRSLLLRLGRRDSIGAFLESCGRVLAFLLSGYLWGTKPNEDTIIPREWDEGLETRTLQVGLAVSLMFRMLVFDFGGD